jgi:hypothetical protein
LRAVIVWQLENYSFVELTEVVHAPEGTITAPLLKMMRWRSLKMMSRVLQIWLAFDLLLGLS